MEETVVEWVLLVVGVRVRLCELMLVVECGCVR